MRKCDKNNSKEHDENNSKEHDENNSKEHENKSKEHENKSKETDKTTDNIIFSLIEEEIENASEFDLTEMLNDIYNLDFTDANDSSIIPQIINYKENYTVKELLLICEYYGASKELKANKCNKDEIIHFLVIYELNPINSDIVFKRQNLWVYINELKNDKFMKKYVLW